MSPQGRPKGEQRSAERDVRPPSPQGRPKGERRSAPRAEAETVLAFDFGTHRIGVAVGNTLLKVARPLTTIAAEANVERFAAIAALIADWRPARLVVGRPVHADGAAHETTALAERFACRLEGRFGLEVTRVDERYTSVDADAALVAAGVRGAARKAARDAAAAQRILQSWLDDANGASGGAA